MMFHNVSQDDPEKATMFYRSRWEWRNRDRRQTDGRRILLIGGEASGAHWRPTDERRFAIGQDVVRASIEPTRAAAAVQSFPPRGGTGRGRTSMSAGGGGASKAVRGVDRTFALPAHSARPPVSDAEAAPLPRVCSISSKCWRAPGDVFLVVSTATFRLVSMTSDACRNFFLSLSLSLTATTTATFQSLFLRHRDANVQVFKQCPPLNFP